MPPFIVIGGQICVDGEMLDHCCDDKSYSVYLCILNDRFRGDLLLVGGEAQRRQHEDYIQCACRPLRFPFLVTLGRCCGVCMWWDTSEKR